MLSSHSFSRNLRELFYSSIMSKLLLSCHLKFLISRESLLIIRYFKVNNSAFIFPLLYRSLIYQVFIHFFQKSKIVKTPPIISFSKFYCTIKPTFRKNNWKLSLVSGKNRVLLFNHYLLSFNHRPEHNN